MYEIKDLNKKLVSKVSGSIYVYVVNNFKFEIQEFNWNKGWCLNTYKMLSNGEYELKDSYGYNGLTLKSCKEMILMNWNDNLY